MAKEPDYTETHQHLDYIFYYIVLKIKMVRIFFKGAF